jgi:hypothetical protein
MNEMSRGGKVQEIPPIVQTPLAHFPGVVYHPGPGPILAIVDDHGRIFFSGSCIYVPPAEWIMDWKAGK